MLNLGAFDVDLELLAKRCMLLQVCSNSESFPMVKKEEKIFFLIMEDCFQIDNNTKSTKMYFRVNRRLKGFHLIHKSLVSLVTGVHVVVLWCVKQWSLQPALPLALVCPSNRRIICYRDKKINAFSWLHIYLTCVKHQSKQFMICIGANIDEIKLHTQHGLVSNY